MNKLITYTAEQIAQLKGLLNGITTTGIQNAKQVAVMAQILDTGLSAELTEEGENRIDDTE